MSAAQPDDPLPEDKPRAEDPADAGRADWLVGAEEGLAAELSRSESAAGAQPRPTLIRPDASPAPGPAAPAASAPTMPTPLAATRRPGMVVPDGNDDGFERGPGAMSWEPGARSVPTLRRAAPANPRASAPAPARDFPMDDAEERARDVAAGRPAPAPELEHAVVSPEAFDVNVVDMPWWMQVIHTLRTDRRVQVLVGVAVVVLTTIALWPRGERPVSIASLRKHATSFDGVDVKIAGRVGQVFQVGGGYAYYLHDGRDTLVVFTRGREPRPRQQVTVHGTMSTGYLDGQSTLALFESAASR